METPEKKPASSARKALYVVVIVCVIASLAYRYLDYRGLEQSSLLFIGLPAIISVLMIRFLPAPKSVSGMVFMVITIFLLISMIFMGEGMVCVLMAAPIFYGIGAIIVLIEYLIKRNRENKNTFLIAVVPIVLLLGEVWKMNDHAELRSVESSMVVTENVTLNNLNKQVNLSENLPAFFNLGYPVPTKITGSGIAVGDLRSITFLSNTKGEGVLDLKVTAATENSVTFSCVNDASHINHWLQWKDIIFSKEIINGETKINWECTYYCELSPKWYFEPMEKYAVELAADHLLALYFK